jgi:hypothetical protein
LFKQCFLVETKFDLSAWYALLVRKETNVEESILQHEHNERADRAVIVCVVRVNHADASQMLD